MTKQRRAVIESAAVFVVVFAYGWSVTPTLMRWEDFLNPFNARFDLAVAELIGMSFIPLVPAAIWYTIRRPRTKSPQGSTPRSDNTSPPSKEKTQTAPASLAPEEVKPRKPMLITPLVVIYTLAGILALLTVRWGIFLGGAQFVIAWGTSKMRRWAWYANLVWCGLAIVGWFMGSLAITVLILFVLIAVYMLLPDTRRAFGISKSRSQM